MGHAQTTTTVRQMSQAESAWVGAMIEAEGSINYYQIKGQVYPRIFVSNTDIDIIATLLRFTGAGSVCLRTARVNKPVWIWSLSSRLSFLTLTPQIRPWMIAKGDKLGEFRW